MASADLVGARISLADARRFVLRSVATSPTSRASVRAHEVARRRERGSEIDADSLIGRWCIADASEPADEGRIANVLRYACGRVTSHAQRSAADIAAGPFAVVGEPWMALRALVCLTDEGRYGLRWASGSLRLWGASVVGRARCNEREQPK